MRKGKRMISDKIKTIELHGESRVEAPTVESTPAALNVSSNEVAAATRAVHGVVKNLTYMGVNVGSHITNDECRSIVTAAISAIESFRARK